ncbi:hypothetical protein M569_02644 [Genlisea aurea]|uniref:HMA domain-containing protein n=1 Tax=Genlisea aurea TaxID=192259 RepID=S8D3Y1_9LAMI|nr:hypothetical protein M569_02644 [Genlisea aurea]
MEEISAAADDGHGPAIDRHNPIIRDPTRIAKLILSEKKKKKKKNVDEFDEAKKHGDDDGGASKNDGDDEFISSIGSPVEVFSTPLVDMKRVSEYDIDIEKATPPSSPRQSYFQVIVLKVSMHCKGCERKMRKHLSKMDGLYNFI